MGELCKELHCDYYTLRRLMWEHGIQPRRRGRFSMHTFKLTESIFQAICRDGVSLIAQRIGISYVQLLRHLKTDPRVPEWEKRHAQRASASCDVS